MNKRVAAALVGLGLLLTPVCLWGLWSGDTDAFYHLAGGRWMFAHQQVLDHEAFSFTIAGRAWTNYYWLFECLLYGAERLGGVPGLIAFRAALILGTAALLFLWILRRTGGRLLEAIAFELVAMALYLPRAINLRPHLFSYLFIVVLFLRLERFGERRRWIDWPIVAVCALWANLHGVELPIVLGILVIHAAVLARKEDRARWAVLIVASMAAFLLNPFGAQLFLTPTIGADPEVMAQITEMQPLSLESVIDLTPRLAFSPMQAFHCALLVGALLFVRWIRRRDWLPAAFFAVGALLPFLRGRFVTEFAFLAVPFVAAGVAQVRIDRPHWGRTVTWALAAFAVYQAATLSWITNKELFTRTWVWEDPVCPTGPVAFLKRAHLNGNIASDPGNAGYITWALPDSRIFMDMRTPEPFDARLYWLTGTFIGAGEPVPFEALAKHWPIDFVILERSNPLAGRLLADTKSAYAPIYADFDWILFAGERPLEGRSELRLRTVSRLPMLAFGQPTPFDADTQREAERLVAASPEDHLAQQALLALMVMEKKVEDARTKAAELARRYPDQAGYAYFHGVALARQGHFDAAVAQLKRACAHASPELVPAAQRELADAYLQLGQPQAGLAVMEEALAQRKFRLSGPDYALLGQLRQASGRLRPAIEAWERALWLLPVEDPTRPMIESDAAAASLDAGDPARALEHAEAALASPQAPPEAALNRANALWAMGKKDEARRSLRETADDAQRPPAMREAARKALERMLISAVGHPER